MSSFITAVQISYNLLLYAFSCHGCAYAWVLPPCHASVNHAAMHGFASHCIDMEHLQWCTYAYHKRLQHNCLAETAAVMAATIPPRSSEDDNDEPHDSIALTAVNGHSRRSIQGQDYTSSSSDENIISFKEEQDNNTNKNDSDDVEAGLKSGGSGGDHTSTSDDDSMRGRKSKKHSNVYTHWQSPYEPSEDHTNPQYIPPFLLRLLSSILALPFINRISTFLTGGPSVSRQTSLQPRLWHFKFIDQYIERPLVRFTKWAKYPLVLWVFLLAWFLGNTFIARAAWWNAPVGSEVQWLDGTSTYWQRNDGCGLGGFIFPNLSCMLTLVKEKHV